MEYKYKQNMSNLNAFNAIPLPRKYTGLTENVFLKSPKHEIIKTDYLIS